MTDDPTLRQALAYARRGWPVFPCCSPTLRMSMLTTFKVVLAGCE